MFRYLDQGYVVDPVIGGVVFSVNNKLHSLMHECWRAA